MKTKFVKSISAILSAIILIASSGVIAAADKFPLNEKAFGSCNPDTSLSGKPVITYFEQLENAVRDQTSKTGISLPGSLNAIVAGLPTQVPVTWTDQNGYNNNKPPLPGVYIFTAQPSDAYELSGNVALPEITGRIIVGGVDYSVGPQFAGSGTKEDPYLIEETRQLEELPALVNSNDEFFNAPNIYYKLKEDIDFSKATKQWTPIGILYTPFRGQFDGNGKVITGFRTGASENGTGMFGTISEEATIKNLGLVNVVVSGGENVGGIVGNCAGKIENCFVTGAVSGGNNVGGIAGRATKNIINSYSTCSVTGKDYVGGIAGSAADISYCYSTGKISANNFAGGIAGSADVSHSAALNKSVTVTTKVSSKKIGRITSQENIFNANIAYENIADEDKNILSDSKSKASNNGAGKTVEEINAEVCFKDLFKKSEAWTFSLGTLPTLRVIKSKAAPAGEIFKIA